MLTHEISFGEPPLKGPNIKLYLHLSLHELNIVFWVLNQPV
jgi:hypothetical protein